MADYDRHRALADASRVEWQGQQFQYSPDLVAQLTLAKAALEPDGPFEAMKDMVECVLGTQIVTVRRFEVNELLDLALAASVARMRIINGVTDKGPVGG